MPRPSERLIFFLAVLVLTGSLTAEAADSKATTRIFLVRHAEKADGDDPPLTAEGRTRADELARAIGDSGVVAVYSSQFNRTRETATPTAERMGLEVEVSPLSSTTLAKDLADLARRILDRHQGQTVLVVGHSNTVPPLIEALGVAEAPKLTDADYDDLFLVTVDTAGTAVLVHMHYGARTP